MPTLIVYVTVTLFVVPRTLLGICCCSLHLLLFRYVAVVNSCWCHLLLLLRYVVNCYLVPRCCCSIWTLICCCLLFALLLFPLLMLCSCRCSVWLHVLRLNVVVPLYVVTVVPVVPFVTLLCWLLRYDLFAIPFPHWTLPHCHLHTIYVVCCCLLPLLFEFHLFAVPLLILRCYVTVDCVVTVVVTRCHCVVILFARLELQFVVNVTIVDGGRKALRLFWFTVTFILPLPCCWLRTLRYVDYVVVTLLLMRCCCCMTLLHLMPVIGDDYPLLFPLRCCCCWLVRYGTLITTFLYLIFTLPILLIAVFVASCCCCLLLFLRLFYVIVFPVTPCCWLLLLRICYLHPVTFTLRCRWLLFVIHRCIYCCCCLLRYLFVVVVVPVLLLIDHSLLLLFPFIRVPLPYFVL